MALGTSTPTSITVVDTKMSVSPAAKADMGECAVGVTVLLYCIRTFVLGVVFGQIEADVAAYANTYYLIVEASTVFLAIYCAGAALFRVMGNSKISMLFN